jgi:pimeloyl-ACP methyl ester carboxylesterase
MKPTIILVHGAWADGSNWRNVIAELKKHGHEAVAAQIPLTSFAEDVEAVVRLAARQQQPVVLVGHSYAGAVITAAANLVRGTKALVYITAYAPDEGETIGALRQKFPNHPLCPQLAPDENGFVWMSLSGIQNAFAHDVSDAAEQWLIFAAQRPIAGKILGESMPAPAWKNIPSWYLVCEDDRMADAKAQRFMAERAHSTVRSIPSGHMSLISHPQDVANLIADAAQASA